MSAGTRRLNLPSEYGLFRFLNLLVYSLYYKVLDKAPLMTQPSPRKDKTAKLLARLDTLTPQELKRYLAQELTRKKLGLVWESDLIERDQALNSNLVFPALNEETSELNEQGGKRKFNH